MTWLAKKILDYWNLLVFEAGCNISPDLCNISRALQQKAMFHLYYAFSPSFLQRHSAIVAAIDYVFVKTYTDGGTDYATYGRMLDRTIYECFYFPTNSHLTHAHGSPVFPPVSTRSTASGAANDGRHTQWVGATASR